MGLLKEYSSKYGIEEVINSMGEHRFSTDHSIAFPNGWVASIVENKEHPEINKKYSVAMCDYNGYFDWNILNQHGAIDGCLYCDNELEIIVACETIRRLEG